MSAPVSYAAQAKLLLAEQFSESTTLHALLAALALPFEELELQWQKLLYLRGISLSEGAQLDRLGEVLGEPRSDRSDVDYRFELAAVVRQNVHQGTPDAFIELVQYLSGSNEVEYTEDYPAAFTIVNNGELILDLVDRIRPLIPAGVGPVTLTQSDGTVVL